MALSIVLSGDNSSYYSSGDMICGVVKLCTTEPSEPCESLSIIFVGQTQVSLTRHDADMVSDRRPRHLSQGFLVRKSILLESATNIQGPGTSYWPFSFLIPTHVDFSLGHDSASWGDLFECHTPWKGSIDADAHSLPPSMCYNSGFRCSVTYALIARLIREPGALLQSKRDLSATHIIQIRHRDDHLSQITNQHKPSIQSVQCDFPVAHGGVADRIGLCARKMTKLTECLSKPQTMSRNGVLRLRVILPLILKQNDPRPIPIGISFRYIGSDPVEADEKVSVTYFTVELLSTSNVRAGMRRQEQTTIMPLYKSSFTQSLRSGTAESSQAGDDGAENLDTHMGTILRSALRKYDLVPEFATYNIHRAYSLRIRMKFRAFGQTVSFRKDNIPLQLPGIFKAEADNRGISPYSATMDHSTSLDDWRDISHSLSDQCGPLPPVYSSRAAEGFG